MSKPTRVVSSFQFFIDIHVHNNIGMARLISFTIFLCTMFLNVLINMEIIIMEITMAVHTEIIFLLTLIFLVHYWIMTKIVYY